MPESAGLDPTGAANVVICEWNDLDRLEQVFVEHPGEIGDVVDGADPRNANSVMSCPQLSRKTKWPGTVERYGDNMKRVRSGFGAIKVCQLCKPDVFEYRQQRLDAGVSPRTVNMEVKALSSMVTFGVENGLIGSNPIAGIKQLPNDLPAKQRRSLTAEEVESLILNSSPLLRSVWYALLTTGVRKEEIVELRFTDVDFKRRVIKILAENAKGKKRGEIPICDGLFFERTKLRDACLSRRPVVRFQGKFLTDHIFVNSVNSP